MDEAPTQPLPRTERDQHLQRYQARSTRLTRWEQEERERRARLKPKAQTFDPVAAALARARGS